MGVRAPDGGRAAVQIIAHGELFARGVGVDLGQRDVVFTLRLTQDLVRAQKRVVRPIMHIAPADQVHHQQPQTLRAVVNAPALPRALRSEVRRAQDVLPLVQIGRDLLFGKRMVAQRDHIRARGEDIVRLFGRDAAPGGVFAVDDHKIHAVRALDAAQQRVQGIDAGLADHVADREKFHACSSLFCIFRPPNAAG